MAENLFCPKNEKCRDMKQSHFSALSHPAFEELIREQMDNEDLTLPERIPFGRNDRMMLLRQLKNLQKVMKKKRDVSSSQQSIAINPITEQSLNKSAGNEKSKPTKRAAASSPVSVDIKKTRKSHVSNKSVPIKDLQKLLLKEYELCESQASREKFRKDAVEKLDESKQLPHLEPPGKFLIKYKKATPYSVFLSRIEDSSETWKQLNSITFPEILDKSLGEIEESFHITDKIDMNWLRLQYLLAGQKTDSTILCSRRIDKTSLPNTIGIYNFDQKSKITMLKYKNGARIVIPSANLYSDDWYYRTQTVWISPHLPYLSKNSNSAEGESKTGFKKTFTKYLMELNPESNAKINIAKWLGLCSTLDFSMINVFFIGCVPGKSFEWGLSNLADLLIKHVTLENLDEWPIVIQNSITANFSFGNKYWLDHELTYELSFCKGREWGDSDEYSNQNNPELHFVYPTKKNFENSSDPLAHHNKNISTKKKYPLPHSDWKIIEPYSHQWKSKSHARDRAMPGCNYYTRISPEMDQVPWIVITSANLGDFSWGYKFNDERENRKDYSYQKLRMHCNNAFEPLLEEYIETHIDNFAAGILFLPKFLTGQATFPIQKTDENGVPSFPVPFDFPLKEYDRADEPLVFKDYSGDVKDCIFKKRTKVSVAAVSKRYDYPSSPEPSENSDDSDDDYSDKENKCILS